MPEKLKTTKELLSSIQQEYRARLNNGEKFYRIQNFYAFYHVDKYFSQAQKAVFAKEALLLALDFLDAKKQELLQANTTFNHVDFQVVREEKHPYETLFRGYAPFAVKAMVEPELQPFLDYYNPNHILKRSSPHNSRNPNVDLNNLLLHLSYILDLVILFQREHQLSPSLVQKLLTLKENLSDSQREYHIKMIDRIINNKGQLSNIPPIKTSKNELSAKSLATGKKWQWLQDYDFKFIDDENQFYRLVEQLSKINYFNKVEVAEVADIDAPIDPTEYEVFILDLYHETVQEGKKRSAWFVKEKVIAFQIFVWLMHYLDTPNQYSILSKLAEKCFQKIPRVGPTSRKLGDTVLKILDESETIEGLGVLLSLKAKNKYPVFHQALDLSIKKAISFTRLDPNEVEDFFIADYGLKNGKVSAEFGAYRSEIVVDAYNEVKLFWFKPNGAQQKSVPAKVKNEFASELKSWKAKHKDIKRELSGQRLRIEGFWKKKKTWTLRNWSKYLLDNQLLQFITTRLIWQFQTPESTVTAMSYDGNLVDASGTVVNPPKEAVVSLWHPSHSTVEEVQAWRNFLITKEIKQPFKQAYREVYLVTDAEIETETYSNRFLDHIVRHHKFAALAKQRNWVYANVYADHYPYAEYPDYQIEVTFDLTQNYDLATTGRVHFRDLKKGEAMPMDEVPTVIFSEAMRDVDLFVGVCSIGLEEEWNNTHHRGYWRRYSTSDLSETAKTRRSVLEGMLPKLKIGSQCELQDRYLKVNGKLRTYKIHLGSGNILMEPNDQYLCIVPSRSKRGPADQVFLPFDEDAVFSIILSKAFLLADDDKVKDPVILNQINRK